MNQKSNSSMDTLVKRIYSSYIDIKSGDFKEIDKDILLNDIRALYTLIKEIYPSNLEQIHEIEKEIQEEKANPKPLIHEIVEIPPASKEEIIEEKPASKEIDLTLFLEDENIVEVTPSPSELEVVSEKKEAVAESKISNLIVENIVREIPIEKNIEAETKTPPIEIKKQEPEKKSADKIMDFLHDGDNPQKDIYSLLDINTRIGLVELFFKGNSLELTDCLMKINKLKTKSECIEVIDQFATKFGVKKSEDIYQSFTQLIDRKFQFFG